MDKKLLLLFIINFLLFLIAWSLRKRKKPYKFFHYFFIIFFAFTFVECLYRLVSPKEDYIITSDAGRGAYRYIPGIGTSVVKKGAIHFTKISLKGDTIYNVSYKMIPDSGENDLKMSHRVGFKANSIDSAEIVFLGCSLVFGSGLNDDETLPYLAGSFCHLSTLNFGLSGSGTQYAYQLFNRKYAQGTDHQKRIFVYSFMPDHIFRAKCIYPWNESEPFFPVENDSLLPAVKAYRASGYALAHRLTIYATLYNSFSFITDLERKIVTGKAFRHVEKADYQRVYLMLKNMQATSRRQQGNLIVINWDKYNWGGYDEEKFLSRENIREMMEQLKKSGAIILTVSDILDVNDGANFISRDGHPNVNANHLLAQLICNIIHKK